MKRSILALLVLTSFGAMAHGHNHGGDQHGFNGHSFNGGHFGHGRHMGNGHSFTGFSRGSINMGHVPDGMKQASHTFNTPRGDVTVSAMVNKISNTQVQINKSIQAPHYQKITNTLVTTGDYANISRTVDAEVFGEHDYSRPQVEAQRSFTISKDGVYAEVKRDNMLKGSDIIHTTVLDTQTGNDKTLEHDVNIQISRDKGTIYGERAAVADFTDKTLSFTREHTLATANIDYSKEVKHTLNGKDKTLTVERDIHNAHYSQYKEHPYAFLTSVYSATGVTRSLDTNIHVNPRPAPTPSAPATTYDDHHGDVISFWWM